MQRPRAGGGSTKPREIGFARGDFVMAHEGELQGLTGTVVSVDPGTTVVTIEPSEDHELDAEFSRLNFFAAMLVRHVRRGEHVRVVGGRHAGTTGRVVNALQVADGSGQQRWVALVRTDDTAREIQVFVQDVCGLQTGLFEPPLE